MWTSCNLDCKPQALRDKGEHKKEVWKERKVIGNKENFER
jgi:hypothetical protein